MASRVQTGLDAGATGQTAASLVAGFSGATRNACVTLCSDDRILGICEQERITRVRAAGFNASGLPDEALDELLRKCGRVRTDIAAYALADEAAASTSIAAQRLDHHLAHACAAFLTSPFEAATIVVADHESPQMTVWDACGTEITRIDWPWHGSGLAELYSECAEALGFAAPGGGQRMEALARLGVHTSDQRACELFDYATDRLNLSAAWKQRVNTWTTTNHEPKEAVAAALQNRIGELLMAFLGDVRRRAPARSNLCLGGSLFHNSHFNSLVRLRAGFDQVFVPVNPGNAGLSVGAALHARGNARLPVTPFMGPTFSEEDIKTTIDNCKLTYQWVSDSEAIAVAVESLLKGRLVAWFDGPMEWGPRALGGRSILANPFAPYVLDNLNRFLKHREVWRGYALSGLETAVHQHFIGPEASPFMECDYTPRNAEEFRHILPSGSAAVRVQTVTSAAPARFRSLLHAFGEASGMPVLVNTSFNGFREPIVCSPRDAVRVFYGTGIDLLAMGPFVIGK